MAKNLFNKNIFKLILAIFFIELLSLISFKSAIISAIFFILISIAVLLFTLYKLECGLYIALIELMIGSYGYLFYLQLPGFKMPIRMAIFLIVFFVWLIKFKFIPHFSGPSNLLKQGINYFKKDHLIQNLFIFIIFLGIGFINGLLHHNGLANTFFDFNGYLYFGLFFVFLKVFKNERQIINFLKILIASLTYVSLKVFVTLYFFSHGFLNTSDLLYHWIRDTRVGEITYAGANFFRIFFQSQVWSLIGIFIILGLIIIALNRRSDWPIASSAKKSNFLLLLILLIALEIYIFISFPIFFWPSAVAIVLLVLIMLIQKILSQITPSSEKRRFVWLFLILTAVQTSILISFSRSFWLGEIVAMSVLFIFLIFKERFGLKKLAQIFGIALSSGLISIILLISIANFPIPKPSSELALLLLRNRFAAFWGEAGVSSRWNELPVILNQIKEAPILGKGFGTTITFQSEDPRIKNESNPEGWFTTYTFEWGYLDTVTEMGILGLLVYLFFIGQIFYRGITSRFNLIQLGFLIGLVALLVTHCFSPYLNHPLGIGYLMLCAAIFSRPLVRTL